MSSEKPIRPSTRQTSSCCSCPRPISYQAPPLVHEFSVGRQRRKPDAPASQGNDVVVRVQGDEARSLRISRRHFEVVRTGRHLSIIDRSRGNTTLNDVVIPPDQPVPLKSGDRIGLAGVLSLEFSIRDGSTNVVLTGPVGLDAAGEGARGVVMEASLGDMVTVRHD